MKRILFILITIPLIFNSCKKEDEQVQQVLPCLCFNSISGWSFKGVPIRHTSPNCFTPNNDLINDYFKVFVNDSSGLIPYTLSVNGIQLIIDTINQGYNHLGWDGGNSQNGEYNYQITCNYNGTSYQMNSKVSLVRDISNLSNTFDCYPQGSLECTFGDMIDPQNGFIYPTQEDINNW
tara:strand:+ start:148 stop:681 length:534 start_codon:yes stop_codon:yes gene_type:complete